MRKKGLEQSKARVTTKPTDPLQTQGCPTILYTTLKQWKQTTSANIWTEVKWNKAKQEKNRNMGTEQTTMV